MYCLNQHASVNHADVSIKILESVGICHQVPESQLNAFTGLSGSGPAYVSRISCNNIRGTDKGLYTSRNTRGGRQKLVMGGQDETYGRGAHLFILILMI